MSIRAPLLIVAAAVQMVVGASVAAGQSALSGEAIRMSHAAGTIAIDGDLGDEGWRDARDLVVRDESAATANRRSKNVGYLTYDERFFYAAFEFEDPDPSRIRARTRIATSLQYKDIGSDFRADLGFGPQVGYREGIASTGWTFRPTGLVRRLRTFGNLDYEQDRAGALISRSVVPGCSLDTRWNGAVQLRYIDESGRAGERAIGRRLFGCVAQFSRAVSRVRATYTFTARLFVRGIRELSDLDRLEKLDRQFFVKLSYALQR